ncbi:type IX secretion system membrane protein PorP/SprF [Rufibacter sp. LB8]|uniref:PorP/SprF family type IX secretion system membrane protein n=1 Tax=Rufibacter sp. LB8 TaxID=2777781 RepID=UPI00178C6227|nr:type IX secretion system membrane protein PorP/SprF [Rufibacter sp. LB8]
MMKNIGTFLVLLLLTAPAWGQQRPQFTQFMMNSYLLNPGLTGIEDYTDVRIGTRQQWVGLQGAPKTFHISAHTPLNKQPATVRSNSGRGLRKVNTSRFIPAYAHHGVGVMAVVDQAGPLRRTNVNVSYAYHLPITNSVTVSVGAYGGLLRNSFRASEATFDNPADPALGSEFINRNFLDVGLGTWIYSPDFFVGLSGAQLLRTDISSNEGTVTEGVFQKHFIGIFGYKVKAISQVTLIPSIMVKLAEPSPVTVDYNLRAVYAERIWVGASYRSQDAFAIMAGANISYLLDASYSYDYNTSNLNVANSGSHEIVLGLKLFNKSKVICPRWLQ